jgi:hypothetical protein
MSKSNVNPNHYKVAGRERQGEDILQVRHRQKLSQSLARERFENRQPFPFHGASGSEPPPEPEAPRPAVIRARAAKPGAETRPTARKRSTGAKAATGAPRARKTKQPSKKSRPTGTKRKSAAAARRPSGKRPPARKVGARASAARKKR